MADKSTLSALSASRLAAMAGTVTTQQSASSQLPSPSPGRLALVLGAEGRRLSPLATLRGRRGAGEQGQGEHGQEAEQQERRPIVGRRWVPAASACQVVQRSSVAIFLDPLQQRTIAVRHGILPWRQPAGAPTRRGHLGAATSLGFS